MFRPLPTKVALDQELAFFEEAPEDVQRDSPVAAGLSALCLSGGGIRSASFCLGILQVLAKQGMLSRFHYLSTVSGGGFAGGWLQTLISERGGIVAAQGALEKDDALSEMREYTNYLTPERGPFSRDTWAAIVLYLRNLILIWLVIVPMFLLLTTAVIFYRTLLEAIAKPGSYGHFVGFDRIDPGLLAWLPLGLGSIALFAGTLSACLLLPSHRPVNGGRTGYASTRMIFWACVVPAIGWSLLVPGTLRVFLEPRSPASSAFVTSAAGFVARASADPAIYPALGYLVAQVLGYVAAVTLHALACLMVLPLSSQHPSPTMERVTAWLRGMVRAPDQLRASCKLYGLNAPAWLISSLMSSCLLFLVVAAAEAWLLPFPPASAIGDADLSQTLAVLAPLALISVHLLQSVFFVGLRRRARTPDLDREWIARADGQVLLAACSWTLTCLCCLTLAGTVPTILGQSGRLSLGSSWVASLVAFLSGPVAAWFGKQVFTRAQAAVATQPRSDWIVPALNLLALVFAVCVFAYLGGFMQWVLGIVQVALGGCHTDGELLRCQRTQLYLSSPLVLQIASMLLLLVFAMFFGTVNVNRFSMHGVYRNRLARAFLGSARTIRDADPFTDFDDGDSPRLAQLKPKERRLFLVVNMTLNLTHVRRHAWAERMAAPFTATPLACGSAALNVVEPGRGTPELPTGAYVEASGFAGAESRRDRVGREAGASLGGILTISGAAVSPNWGYHSSPLIAFLMTMFNVRLGAWLPNPARATKGQLALSKPRYSILALFSELLGRSTDERQAVYLSDGGHFDNLGLYEMFRRRCRTVVVVDAGQDEDCTFFDLGNAIRKASIDGLAYVTIDDLRIRPRKDLEAPDWAGKSVGHAVGTIRYPGVKDTGRLLYVKPSLVAGAPAAVRAYAAVNPTFPHESTTHQWFSESQFESYRALGEHQMSCMFKETPEGLDAWIRGIEQALAKSGEPNEGRKLRERGRVHVGLRDATGVGFVGRGRTVPRQ